MTETTEGTIIAVTRSIITDIITSIITDVIITIEDGIGIEDPTMMIGIPRLVIPIVRIMIEDTMIIRTTGDTHGGQI